MSTWNSPWLSARFSLAAWRGSPWQTSRGWNPRYLFLAGQQGAWYDPSDLSTLFQDSAGTTPVTADGDPVGLMLDKSKGRKLGVELVSDPEFDNPSAWQQPGSWVVAGGVASTDGSLSGSVFLAAAVAEGNTYKVTVTVNSISGGSVQAFVGSGSTYTINSPGTHTFYLPKGTNENVGVFAGSGVSAEVESFSTRELKGNHATQSVSASKRLYRTDGTLNWLEDDLVDDAITAHLPDLGANATFAYADGSGVTVLTGQTISGDTNLPTVAQTYGAIYLDRPFTASETENVTAYLNKLRGA